MSLPPELSTNNSADTIQPPRVQLPEVPPAVIRIQIVITPEQRAAFQRNHEMSQRVAGPIQFPREGQRDGFVLVYSKGSYATTSTFFSGAPHTDKIEKLTPTERQIVAPADIVEVSPRY